MNENNYIQTTTKSNILHDSIIENMYIKAYESITDAENSSKEKYITKATLIKSSNDMSTQEILTSLDKNYECRNGERRQNVLYFTIISFSVLGAVVVSPIAVKIFINFSQHNSKLLLCFHFTIYYIVIC